MGDMAQANVEWEGEVVVGYYRGKHGLEFRLSRCSSTDQPRLILEYQAPYKDGTVSVTRVFCKSWSSSA